VYQVGRQRGRWRAPGVAPRADRLQRVAAQLVLFVGVEHALELVLDELPRPDRAADIRRVAGDLHDRRRQRRYRQPRQRRRDEVVIVDDGFGGQQVHALSIRVRHFLVSYLALMSVKS
jgi:hypothetical protein